ncbi:hypothetical protein IWQ60_004763 [Tieghemiomyces parasiticus]|uniref:PITH domain-containing protein n=1 Tax=Tieghemiomyces parasiticus TaxID=78921 RepID=A0A9W8AFP9_9FUNG|nr:hypothetical protein IWQ60_004763 [Tieghemiomyces parasiticus]
MSNCQGEAGQSDYHPTGEGHHHHHGHGHGHDHDHDHDIEPALKDSLYGKIDLDRVRCLNEHSAGAARGIFKPWDKRKDREPYLESDCDEQLILFVPFTGMVKLKSILLWGGPEGKAPAKLKVFINAEDVDFDNVEGRKCTQEWDLVEDQGDLIEYHTRVAKFNNVRSLTLFIPENYGDDVTRLQYLGFTGEWTELREDPLVTIYELKPNLADHKTPAGENLGHQNIF